MSSILTYGRSLQRANESLAGLAGRSLSQEPAVILESLDAGASMTTSDQHQGAEVDRTQRSGKSVVPDRAASTQEMAVQGKPIDIGIRRNGRMQSTVRHTEPHPSGVRGPNIRVITSVAPAPVLSVYPAMPVAMATARINQ
jgi:hypothetical protein